MTATSIEWTRGADGSKGFSWNALRAQRTVVRKGRQIMASAHHCERVNEACRFCYAGRGNARLGGLPFKPGHRKDYTFVLDEKKLHAPLLRRKPARWFVESMSDLFGAWWPRRYVDSVYAVIALTPHHTYIDLSKRPERRRDYAADPQVAERIWRLADVLACLADLPEKHPGNAYLAAGPAAARWPLPNVIEGVSVSDQKEADEFIPILLNTRAALRAVSCEPLLAPINLVQYLHDSDCRSLHGDICTCCEPREASLDWVIAGGESGPNARPMHPAWPRSLHDQCALANVPFFFKQWGEWLPWNHFVSAGIDDGDPAEATRFRTMEWKGDRWSDEGYPSWVDSADGSIDDEQCVGRVGKKSAGRLLDGVEHNGFPAVRA